MVYIVRVNMTIEDFTYTHVCDSLEDSKRIVKKMQEKFKIVQKKFKNSRVKYKSPLSCSIVYEDFEVCKIDILIHDKKDVEFHLSKFINGEYKETRRFSTRENAVNFVHRVLDSEGFEASGDEDSDGAWSYHNEFNDEIKYIVSLAIYKTINKAKKNDYFEVLGIKPNATDEVVKKAYHQKIKKYHPDTGGNMQEFLKIQEAYENIINGLSKGNKEDNRVLSERYICMSFGLEQNKHKSDTVDSISHLSSGYATISNGEPLGFERRLSRGLVSFIFSVPIAFCIILFLSLISGRDPLEAIDMKFYGAIFLAAIEAIHEITGVDVGNAIKGRPIKK